MELLEHSGRQLVQDWKGLCDGVSLLEMVEGAISALHQIARDVSSTAYIYNRHNIMKLLVYVGIFYKIDLIYEL